MAKRLSAFTWSRLLLALACVVGCTVPIDDDRTLRLAVSEPILTIDPFVLNRPDWTIYAVYDSLIGYDITKGEAYPLLAESWRRLDDVTLEFDLRRDIEFHDGSNFDADGVVATIEWLIDPQSVYPSKSLYDWIASVEKLGQYRVRIVGREPISRPKAAPRGWGTGMCAVNSWGSKITCVVPSLYAGFSV